MLLKVNGIESVFSSQSLRQFADCLCFQSTIYFFLLLCALDTEWVLAITNNFFEYSVGSGGLVDFQITDDRSVANVHAIFEGSKYEVYVHNLDSVHGTFVTASNGVERRLEANTFQRMEVGEIVRFGTANNRWRLTKVEIHLKTTEYNRERWPYLRTLSESDDDL